ncbi:AAA family ATPase [Calidifontibacter terrae]
MPVLYYLVGPPAVGKLTIGSLLRERTGAALIDNHLINDPVFVPMGVDRTTDISVTDALRKRVHEVVLEAAQAAPAHVSHIFTNWLPDEPSNAQLVQTLANLARVRGAQFLPIWLTCDERELLRRVTSADRGARAKLRDPAVLRELLKRPGLPAPADALQLDTTDLTPAESADRIVAFADQA